MADPRAELGLRGERAAERLLKRRGLRLIQRRFACSAGEIDLIMRDGECVVFVEVKTQSDDTHLAPYERVTREKQRRIGRAARFYVTNLRRPPAACRFDVVSVLLPAGQKPRVEHFPDAFIPPAWD
ncbi:MAG: YraN family protein [Planctomycetota bacterium]|nr:MAG: YraN family protein [Planctomycetota bacterium]